MQPLLDAVRDLWAIPIARGVAAAIVGIVVVVILARVIANRQRRAGSPHRAMVLSKAILYCGMIVVLSFACGIAELPIGPFLATAGVAGIAIGLAAQTSLANVIAGVFLLIDRPFRVGDPVQIEGELGVVERVTLLSTFIRTFGNVQVRWPNEVVLKAKVLNLGSYPARRIDLPVGVAYGTDVPRAREVIADAVSQLDIVLLDPTPQVLARGFGDSSVDLEARVWVSRTDFLVGRSQVVEAIHEALRQAGIEIPFPQRTVWHRGLSPPGPPPADARYRDR